MLNKVKTCIGHLRSKVKGSLTKRAREERRDEKKSGIWEGLIEETHFKCRH